MRPLCLPTALLSFGKYQKHIQGHQIDLGVRGFVKKILRFDKKGKKQKVETYGEGKPHSTVVGNDAKPPNPISKLQSPNSNLQTPDFAQKHFILV